MPNNPIPPIFPAGKTAISFAFTIMQALADCPAAGADGFANPETKTPEFVLAAVAPLYSESLQNPIALLAPNSQPLYRFSSEV